MSSFTPFYDPSLSLYQANFFTWLALNDWNSNHIMVIPIKNQQNSENQIFPFIVQDKKPPSSTEFNPISEEYEPQSKVQGYQLEERKNCGRIQCKGRNDYSNILKAFIHMIKTQVILKDKIKTIISAKRLALNYERFLLRIRRKFSKGKTYISPKQILIFLKSCSQSKDQGEKGIGLIFNILLRNFLSVQYKLNLIKSFKGKKQSRVELIMKTRQLSKILFQDGLQLQEN